MGPQQRWKNKPRQRLFKGDFSWRDCFYWALFWAPAHKVDLDEWTKRAPHHIVSRFKRRIHQLDPYTNATTIIIRGHEMWNMKRSSPPARSCLRESETARTAASNWSSHSQDFWFQTLQIIESATVVPRTHTQWHAHRISKTLSWIIFHDQIDFSLCAAVIGTFIGNSLSIHVGGTTFENVHSVRWLWWTSLKSNLTHDFGGKIWCSMHSHVF